VELLTASNAGVVALITAIGSLILAWESRRKIKAETAAAITNAAGDLVEHFNKRLHELSEEVKCLREENNALREQVDGLKAENKQLRNGLQVLSDQLSRLGHKPDWTVPW